MNIYVNALLSISSNSKYTKWCKNIIDTALLRSKTISNYSIRTQRKHITKSIGYVEGHHILPKCLCETFEDIKNKENIVFLTAREHYIVHWLLCKMLPSNKHKYKMYAAFSAFLKSIKNQYHGRKITSIQYTALRKYHSEQAKFYQKGRPKKQHKNSRNSKQITIVGPANQKYICIGNVSDMCKQLGLRYDTLKNITKRGIIPQKGPCVGWKLVYES